MAYKNTKLTNKIESNANWFNQAVNLLERNTSACHDIIVSYVKNYWTGYDDDDDNVSAFEDYLQNNTMFA